MELSDFDELHYITDISNVPSIMTNGILSHNLVEKVVPQHKSVAMEEIQERRDKKRVLGGRFLHDYVNLYFCARNPMLYKRRDSHAELCVLKINKEVLNLQNVMITDRNASSDSAKFVPFPSGLSEVNKSLVFAKYWRGQDGKSVKCAEALVPDKVDICYISGVYVSCSEANSKLKKIAPNLDIIIRPDIFFRER